MKNVLFFMLLSVSVYSKIQGQTVVYTYNAQGSCSSRIYANSAQKAKSVQKSSTAASSAKVVVSPYPKFSDNITISDVKTNLCLVYTLINASGQIVQKGSFTKESVTLSTSNLPNGIYLLKVDSDNYEHSYKLIKE
jgi:hypothetical protein